MPVMTTAEKVEYDARVLASTFQDKTAITVDSLVVPGLYYCETDLPIALTSALIEVTKTNFNNTIIQEASDYSKKDAIWFRKSLDGGTTWEPWVDESQALSANEVEVLIREFATIVEYDLADPKKPTRAECIETFKLLPNFDWALEDLYHIRDVVLGDKIVMVTYIPDGATDEATAGPFFFKDMTETV